MKKQNSFEIEKINVNSYIYYQLKIYLLDIYITLQFDFLYKNINRL
jgi:hypothetical protein